jgi:formylglycine-generating enzyme required for sulfatase activity
MGDESEWPYPGDGEGPVHEVDLAPFRINRYAVSNRHFAEFVEGTGWRTDAERCESSLVFGGLLPDDFPPTRGVESALQYCCWVRTPSAIWPSCCLIIAVVLQTGATRSVKRSR